MCDNAIYYNSCNLWTYWDDGVTNCSMNFDLFVYQTAEQSKIQTAKFKFGIYGKESANTSVTLTNCELYKLSYYCKQKIITPLKTLNDKLTFDKKFTDGFCIKGRNKNIYVTFMYQPLLNTPCIRFMIGEKEQSLVDTDKIYIPLIEFNSLYLSMNKAFDNFPLLSQNVMFMDMFKKFNEQLDEKFGDLDRTIITEFKKFGIPKTEVYSKEDTDVINTPVTFDESVNDELPKVEIVEDNNQVEKQNEEHLDFDNFLKDKRDSFQLDLPEEKNFQPPQEMDLDNTFQKKILINGFCDLEKIILSCINSKIPLDSFKNTIYQLSGENLYDGLSVKDQYALNYVTTDSLKINFKRYLEKQIPLPKVLPIITDDNSNSKFKTDLMIFLVMSYIYISKINNDLDGITDGNINKSVFNFSLKTITSPFIFSYLIKQKKDVFISCVTRLYTELLKSNYFKEFEDSIYNSTHKHVEMTVDHLKSQLEKMYDNLNKVKDRLYITSFFKKWMKLNYTDFDNISNEFDSKKAGVIIDLEYSKSVETTYDLDINILKKFGLDKQKFKNSNLINYIKSKNTKFKDLEQIKTINVSIREILDKVDLNLYPVNVLRALYFWEVNSKDISYDDYCKMIENSSLNEQQLISMILDSRNSVDENFYNSLEIV